MNLHQGLRRLNAVIWGIVAFVFSFDFIHAARDAKFTAAVGMIGMVLAMVAAYRICQWVIDGFWVRR